MQAEKIKWDDELLSFMKLVRLENRNLCNGTILVVVFVVRHVQWRFGWTLRLGRSEEIGTSAKLFTD